MSLLIVFMVAVSLSMDAFSLSLAYGTLNLNKKSINTLSLIVGIYHFFMPILGMFVGSTIIYLLPITPNTLVFMVLFLIGVQMIIESFKEDKNVKKLNFLEMLLFGFAVSIDSFTLGLGLRVIYKVPLISASVFSITSFLFTYIGLTMGKKINEIVGRLSTIIGGILLIIISIMYVI